MSNFLNFTKEHVILVTGATSGIGKATVLEFLKYGAKVVAIGRNTEKLKELQNLNIANDRLFIEKFDLAENIEDIDFFIKELVQKYGKISGFVHSAGAIRVSSVKFEDLKEQKKLFDLNYFSAISIIKCLSNKKYKAENLSCVLLSSIAGINGDVGLTTYSGTKGAIISSVKSLAKELGKSNIRVNAISPGTIKTNISQANPALLNEQYYEKIKEKWVLPYESSTEQIANLILFLISSASSWITGSNVIIDGGESL